MRIVVISDSHGDPMGVRQVLLSQSAAEAVIFCGDGIEDIESARTDFPEKAFYMVRGNCDWGSNLETVGTVTLSGVKIFYTHGHMQNVKYGDNDVIDRARSSGASILLYGHTHTPITDYADGLYIMNPGSLHGSFGTYGIVDITKNGIVTNIIGRK